MTFLIPLEKSIDGKKKIYSLYGKRENSIFSNPSQPLSRQKFLDGLLINY